MFKIPIIIFAMLLFMIGVCAQEKKNPITERRIDLVRNRIGVDSLTATRIIAIEQRYKAAVSSLVLTGGLAEKDLRQRVNELIKAKNTDLGKLLPNAVLLTYLPTDERIEVDPSYPAQFRSSRSRPVALGKKEGDTVNSMAMPARKRAVYDIVAIYEGKVERLNRGKLDASSRAVELKRLEAERDGKIAAYLSTPKDVKKDKKN